ncbi:MAG: sigma-70 family RNA polymerase sigma factor [Novosphingobium sp.]|nr:sigma-70 family RNA polymerase sigma factor [Novosphingobium sp.]
MTLSAAIALEQTFGMYNMDLRRFLNSRIDTFDAEDILQDLWVRLQNMQQPINLDNARSYLYRAASNLLIDRVREKRRRMHRERRWHDFHTDFSLPDTEVVDRAKSVEEEIIRRQTLLVLSAAVSELPAGARKVFTLHKIDGLSHADVAARLGISRSGVEKHMAVALKHLKLALRH